MASFTFIDLFAGIGGINELIFLQNYQNSHTNTFN